MASDPEVPIDAEELEQLVRFVKASPGEIAGAVVPGPAGGNAVIARVSQALSGELEIADPDPTFDPDRIGELATKLADTDTLLIVRLDGLSGFFDEEDLSFWQRMNYQRERLAQGRLRVLLMLDPDAERTLAAAADDLRDWVSLFRFPDAVSTTPPVVLIYEPEPGVARRNDDLLAALRAQLERGRKQLPPELLLRDRVMPLLHELVACGDWDEASRVWKEELMFGRAWQHYRDSLPSVEQLGAGEAQRLAGELLDIQAAALYAGHGEIALEAAMEALEIRRRQSTSTRGQADLAEALSAASRCLIARGRLEEARAMIEQSLSIYRGLGDSTRDHRPQRARALLILEFLLGDNEEGERALEAAREAVRLYRALENDRRAPPRALPHALVRLSNRLKRQGKHDEARRVRQEMHRE